MANRVWTLTLLWLLAVGLWAKVLSDHWRFRSAIRLRLLACGQIQAGHERAAAATLERALETDATQLDIAGDLACLYWQLGEPGKARAALDRAVALALPLPAELTLVYRQRGLFLLKTGRFAEAASDLRMARAWEPGNEELRIWLLKAQRLAIPLDPCLPEPIPSCYFKVVRPSEASSSSGEGIPPPPVLPGAE